MGTILVIDDEKAILEMLRLILMKFGHHVVIAANGKEGIQKFKNGEFDLVITDILMPGMDGNHVVDHIRHSERHLTPVIGITGTPWLGDDSSFSMVLPKPFTIKALIESVKQLTAFPRNATAVG